MAYYYVKSGGTATGDAGRATTQRTGTFAAMGASAYYDSIDDATGATTAPTAGDSILCSSSHDKDWTSSKSFSIPGSVKTISVDDSNADTYTVGGRESTSNGTLTVNTTAGGVISVYGMTFESEDNLLFGVTGGGVILTGCTIGAGTLGAANSSDTIRPVNDGVHLELISCIIKGSNHASSTLFGLTTGFHVDVKGGSIFNNTNGPKFLCAAKGNASGEIKFNGVDLTNMQSMVLIDTISSTVDDNCNVRLYNCKFPSTWTLGESLNTKGEHVTVQNCDDSNDRSISAYMEIGGQYLSNGSVYADNASTVEGQSLSLEVQTTSSASNGTPLRVLVGSVRDDFSTSKTVSLEVVHDAQGAGTGNRFNNDELWIEVYRPNSADPAFLIESSSLSTPLTAATTNASSSETWIGTSMTSETTEVVSITTTTSGGTGWAEVYLCVGSPNIGAGDLFVSHDISVS